MAPHISFFSPLPNVLADSLRRSRLIHLPLAAALVVAATPHAAMAQTTSAQTTARGSATATVSATAPAARIARALISRPRWDVNGSSAAPPKLALEAARTVPAPTPRASHAWFANVDHNTRLSMSQALAASQAPSQGRLSSKIGATPPNLASAASTLASTSRERTEAPGSNSRTPMRVVMSMEVPTSVAGGNRGSNEVFGDRINSGRVVAPGDAHSIVVESDLERGRRERMEYFQRQEHFERAKVEKKRRERVLLAQVNDELSRAQKENRSAKADLTQSVRNLDQFRGVLQKAFLDAGPDATGLHPFVQAAKRYAGTPYVWGGESRGGFDCSGFIIVVMRDLGYKALPHSAAEQFNYGMPVASGLLKPGDLVFFANTYKPGISHVGIYLGRGRFIHAAGTGKGTIVSQLAASPYAEKYAGARRLFRSKR